jgi:serine/threonine-protein kinase
MAQALEAALQPAGALQVGAWVEEIAGDVLQDRGRRVAEVESISSIDAKLTGLVRQSLVSVSGEGASGVTDMSVAHSTRAPGKRSRGPLIALALAMSLFAAAAGALWLMGRDKLQQPAAESAAPSAPPAVAAAAAEPRPEKTPPEPKPTAEPEPVPAPAAAATSAPAQPISKPPAKTMAAPPKKPKKKNCDPPYVMNPDGSKRFKPECF